MYSNIFDSDYILCPICRAKLKRLCNHFNAKHKEINYKQYIKDNPDVLVVSDNFRKEMSESTKEQWKDENFRKLMLESVERQWEDESFREAQSSAMTKWLTERHKNDPEFSRKSLDNLKHSYGIRCNHTLYNGKVVSLRSKLEESIAKKLDRLRIAYDYESIYFNYEYNGESHRYYPDFILTNTNIILECKPDWLTSDELVITKAKSAIDSGYEVIFVGESFNAKSILGRATTIEKITNEKYISE